jgi:hypothetical protein
MIALSSPIPAVLNRHDVGLGGKELTHFTSIALSPPLLGVTQNFPARVAAAR